MSVVEPARRDSTLVRGVDLADPLAVRAKRRLVIRLTVAGRELREHNQ